MPVTADSGKAREFIVKENLRELRQNVRMSLIFGLLSAGAYFVFSYKAVAILIGLLTAVFGIKVIYYGYVTMAATRRGHEQTIEINLFQRRLDELDEQETVSEIEFLGQKTRFIHDQTWESSDIARLVAGNGAVSSAFQEFRSELRREHPEIESDIESMQIAGMEFESDTSLLVYFSGLPGALLQARYDLEEQDWQQF